MEILLKLKVEIIILLPLKDNECLKLLFSKKYSGSKIDTVDLILLILRKNFPKKWSPEAIERRVRENIIKSKIFPTKEMI